MDRSLGSARGPCFFGRCGPVATIAVPDPMASGDAESTTASSGTRESGAQSARGPSPEPRFSRRFAIDRGAVRPTSALAARAARLYDDLDAIMPRPRSAGLPPPRIRKPLVRLEKRPQSSGAAKRWAVAPSYPRTFDELAENDWQHCSPGQLSTRWGPREKEFREKGERLNQKVNEQQLICLEREKDGLMKRSAAEEVQRAMRHVTSGEPWRSGHYSTTRQHEVTPLHVPAAKGCGGLFSEAPLLEAMASEMRYREAEERGEVRRRKGPLAARRSHTGPAARRRTAGDCMAARRRPSSASDY